MKQGENLIPVFQMTASQLSNHKFVANDFSLIEPPSEIPMMTSKVLHPNGCID